MRWIRVVSIIGTIIFVLSACNPLRGPVVDEKDDGKILGTVVISRGKYKEGEAVEVTFTIENVSNELISLKRDDAPVQDLILSTSHIVRRCSDETGKGVRELKLGPGEKSTIEWEIKDLDIGLYTFVGTWWSANIREVEVVAITEYGSARY